MYSVTMGFDAAVDRIKSLLKQSYNSEALVTSVFTAEKTLRRTLRHLVVSAGFISRHADEILRRMNGVRAIGDQWHLYDPEHRTLVNIIGNPDWQTLADAATMRNNMVHGISVYSSAACIDHAKTVLNVLARLKTKLDSEYGYSGWTPHRIRRKSALHVDLHVSRKKT